MKRLKIGIDIDGTVYPWTLAVNTAVMRKFGVEDPGLHTSWNYLKNLLTEEQFAWVWTDDAATDVFGAAQHIYEGAAETLNALAVDHDVHFVTHRNPVRLAAVTGRWLNAHFTGYCGVHVLANTVKKSDVLDWDIFIDDKVETVDEMLDETDALVIIPNRDWNLDYDRAVSRDSPEVSRPPDLGEQVRRAWRLVDWSELTAFAETLAWMKS